MLDQPLTVGNLILINAATILPIIAILAKGVWYLSKIVHQHDQLWAQYVKQNEADRAAAGGLS